MSEAIKPFDITESFGIGCTEENLHHLTIEPVFKPYVQEVVDLSKKLGSHVNWLDANLHGAIGAVMRDENGDEIDAECTEMTYRVDNGHISVVIEDQNGGHATFHLGDADSLWPGCLKQSFQTIAVITNENGLHAVYADRPMRVVEVNASPSEADYEDGNVRAVHLKDERREAAGRMTCALVDKPTVDDLSAQMGFFNVNPVEKVSRVLITVKGGVADWVCDEGIDVELFDYDNYEDDPEGTVRPPPHFADLAEPLGVPLALYRCGYCGRPTDSEGSPLQEVPQCDGWDEAWQTHGTCCVGENPQRQAFVSKEMAIDAGDPSLEGQRL